MTDAVPGRAGFTLVEILVALAVFSLAALALLNLAGENTRSAARVEERTLGGVVAENIAVEASITRALADGQTAGTTHLAGRDWHWTRTVASTDDPGIQRIDIRITGGPDSDGGQVADRVLFRARPL